MPARIEVSDDPQLSSYATQRAGFAQEPVAVLQGESGLHAFAPNRLIVPAEDAARVQGIAAERSVTYTPVQVPFPPAIFEPRRPLGLDDAGGFGILEFHGVGIGVESLAARADGDGVVSSQEGAGTLAYAALLQDQGVRAVPDWFGEPSTVTTSSSEQGGRDAYTWPQFAGRAQFVRAWQLVEAARLLGGGVTPTLIGILDSGFWFDPVTGACLAAPGLAPEFPAQLQQYDFANNTYFAGGPALAPPAPWHGQGTAAIAAAPHGGTGGVAGAAGTVASPVLFRTNLSSSQVIRGVRTAVAWGLDVVNMSFGIKPGSFLGLDNFPDDAFNAAFQFAHDSGVVLVAAAGNDGKEIPDLDIRPATRTPGVITVGALAAPDTNLRASFSNYGVSVDIWALGDDVLVGPDAASSGVQLADGTSEAAPLVAGAAALVMAVNPSLNADQVAQLLFDSAWRGSPDVQVRSGVDAGEAVWRAMGGQFPADLEDAGAGNDTPASARPMVPDPASGTWVPNGSRPRALSRPGDKDFHSFQVTTPSTVQVMLDHAVGLVPGAESPTVILRKGDDADHQVQVPSTRPGHYELTLADASPDLYRVLVIGAQILYDLKVRITGVALDPDPYEPNDSLETATHLSFHPAPVLPFEYPALGPDESYNMTISEGDVDYFHVTEVTPAGGNRYPWVRASSTDVKIRIDVLAEDGRLLRQTDGFHESGSLRLESPSCYVRITCAASTRYSIEIDYSIDYTEIPGWPI